VKTSPAKIRLAEERGESVYEVILIEDGIGRSADVSERGFLVEKIKRVHWDRCFWMCLRKIPPLTVREVEN